MPPLRSQFLFSMRLPWASIPAPVSLWCTIGPSSPSYLGFEGRE